MSEQKVPRDHVRAVGPGRSYLQLQTINAYQTTQQFEVVSKKQSRNNNLKSPKSLPENPQPSSQKSLWLGTKDAKHLALI